MLLSLHYHLTKPNHLWVLSTDFRGCDPYCSADTGLGLMARPIVVDICQLLTNATKNANQRQDGHVTWGTWSSSFSTAPVRMNTTGLWAHSWAQHQRQPSSYMGLASCLKDCLETMVLREDHHKPHQLLLELRCPCPH